jgi:hypothetical protein
MALITTAVPTAVVESALQQIQAIMNSVRNVVGIDQLKTEFVVAVLDVASQQLQMITNTAIGSAVSTRDAEIAWLNHEIAQRDRAFAALEDQTRDLIDTLNHDNECLRRELKEMANSHK